MNVLAIDWYHQKMIHVILLFCSIERKIKSSALRLFAVCFFQTINQTKAGILNQLSCPSQSLNQSIELQGRSGFIKLKIFRSIQQDSRIIWSHSIDECSGYRLVPSKDDSKAAECWPNPCEIRYVTLSYTYTRFASSGSHSGGVLSLAYAAMKSERLFSSLV